MTLVFDKIQADMPQTHALLLGVGRYPHLNGGDGTLTKYDMGLGQLSSPSVSARKLAEWLMQNFNNPAAPLGSLDLFLSEPQPQLFQNGEPGGVQVAGATMASVNKPFYNWLNRCKSHPENILFFYFCGHGVSIAGDPILVLEDYGENEFNPFVGAINFIRMYQGVASAVKGHKCFFVDACSDVPFSALDIINSNVEAFLPTVIPNENWQRLTVLRASVDGSSAFGNRNDVSRFTNALIQCLSGRAAKKIKSKDWRITNQTLTEPLFRVLNSINELEKGKAQVYSPDKNAGEATLQVCPQPPVVPVVIEFDPEEAINDATLKLNSTSDPTWERSRVPAQTAGRWELSDVTVGKYVFEAEFQTQGRRNITNVEIDVTPPGPAPDEPFVIEETQ